MSNITQNIAEIFENINAYSTDPSEVKLIAVTKNRSVSEITKAIQAGVTIIGENRIQEAQNKLRFLTLPVEKHFIGHLQSNKVKAAVQLFDLIQSVDSLKLATKINQECQKIDKIMPILVQVNISADSAKFGLKTEEVIPVLKKMATLPNINIQGLMTIGRLTSKVNQVPACFRELRQLFESIKQAKIVGLNMKYLSMGMSDDYEIALKEGSNMIRIGRGIFE